MKRLILFLFIVTTVAASQANAVDIITRKDALRRLGGTIKSTTKTTVTIEVSGKSQQVPVNVIKSIEWTGQPGALAGYLTSESAGRLQNALDGYQKLLKGGMLPTDRLKSEVQYYATRAAAKIALTSPKKQAAAIAALESHQTKNPESHHFYEAQALLADLYLASKSYAKATTALAELKKAPWKDVQVAAQNSEARVLLAQGKATEALAGYNAVLASVGTDAKMKPIRNAAVLGKAACLKETKKYNESLKVLENVVASAALGESEVLAEAYLLRGDNQLALGNTKDALMAYLHVDVLFAKETKFHPHALSQLARLWKAVGHPTRAAKAQRDLETLYPDWKK